MVEETLLLSWNVQQLGHKVDLLLNSRLPAESWLNFESESRKKFASAYSKLGGKTPVRFEAKAGAQRCAPHIENAALPLRPSAPPSAPPRPPPSP